MDTIRNPIEWISDQVRGAADHGAAAGTALRAQESPPSLRRIDLADIKAALAAGLEDFGACRSDVLLLCLLYPLVGLLLVWVAIDRNLLPLVFPLASGFALIGPAIAVGLYEMSRRREAGRAVTWADAFGVLASPSFGAILALGLLLLALLAAWLFVAQAIYAATLGPLPPDSATAFLGALFTTPEGWTMVVVGTGVGFLFAVVAFAISVVSFPLLLDRPVGLWRAVGVSLRAVRRNPLPMAAWGLVVVAGLVLGALPLLLGLMLVLPILGHATWHLYRRLVAHPERP